MNSICGCVLIRAAAGSSINHNSCAGCTREGGNTTLSSPSCSLTEGGSKISCNRCAFPSPVAINTTSLLLLIVCRVKVIRRLGGLGESKMGTTRLSPVYSRSSWDGKRLAVWPSGPSPRRIKSIGRSPAVYDIDAGAVYKYEELFRQNYHATYSEWHVRELETA
mgnify:CR=1 FL=1